MFREPISVGFVSRSLLRDYFNALSIALQDPELDIDIPEHELSDWIFGDVRGIHPIRSILSIVCNRYDAFGIFECPYVDLEFLDAYGSLYSASFSSYSRSCARLHFFSNNSGEDDKTVFNDLKNGLITESLSEKLLSNLSIAYQGYCVFRDTFGYSVARASIKFDPRSGQEVKNNSSLHLWPGEVDATPYLTVRQNCCSNLLNSQLHITSPEFVQQDPNFGHCATASLWVATHALSRQFSTPVWGLKEIASRALASSYIETCNMYDQDSPESGLTGSEIAKVFASAGLKSVWVNQDTSIMPSEDLPRILHSIYTFVESGLPVLLCHGTIDGTSSHIVAIVGHSLPNKINVWQLASIVPKFDRHKFIGSDIGIYYAHDDLYGPFNKVGFSRPWRNDLVANPTTETSQHNPKRIGLCIGHDKCEYEFHGAIIPMNQIVRQPGHSIPRSVVEEFAIHPACDDGIEEGFILWRGQLVKGSDFKRSLTLRKYDEKIACWYSELHLPYYIWLYEFEYVPEDNATNYELTDERYIWGEFIYDATTPSSDVQKISGRILGMCVSEEKTQILDLKGGGYLYPIFNRTLFNE